MKPQFQTRYNNGGDCVRACIATLLELPIDIVPDFTAMREREGDIYPTWYLELQSWLSKRGYAFIEIQLERKTWMPLPYPVEAIFIGDVLVDLPKAEGKRKRATIRHAVCGTCVDGNFFKEHDPFKDEKHPKGLDFHGGIKAVCLLVPCDPSKMKPYEVEHKSIIVEE